MMKHFLSLNQLSVITDSHRLLVRGPLVLLEHPTRSCLLVEMTKYAYLLLLHVGIDVVKVQGCKTFVLSYFAVVGGCLGKTHPGKKLSTCWGYVDFFTILRCCFTLVLYALTSFLHINITGAIEDVVSLTCSSK